jgi:formamidopyrimidine-DNA glycosylase
MLPRTHKRDNHRMPELPDLDVLADAFTAALTGRRVLSTTTAQPLVLRGTAAESRALEGQELAEVEQRGKFLTLRFERDRIVVNPMLTGRLGLGTPGTKPLAQTALTVLLGPRDARPASSPPWTLAAAWLPADDCPVELRYRDPTRMGKVYLLPAGLDRPVAGWDEQGPDVDDPGLDRATWRRRIARHGGELKNLLRNQAFVAGIGNGYSDEILWAAGLAPFRRRSSLAADEVDRLYDAARDVPPWAIGVLRDRVPPRFEVEVRDFLRVHRKGGGSCPRCGATLSEVSPGGFVTTWCRSCQR